MTKALIITEKPSVARDVVQALGGFAPKAGQAYWESDQYICTYAVGHILSLLSPEDLDPAYRSWKLTLLPILPRAFKLKPIAGHEKRLQIIRELVERDDVTSLINACDAAREGELIFREIVDYLECSKRVRRLWLQSMTTEAIRKGFATLRNGTDLEGLGQASECRARADWLIGMNATRAFSERLRMRGERLPWSVGRVQTPTLALLVDREMKILAHVAEPFFRVVGSFKASGHDYDGTWFNHQFKADDAHPEKKDDRIFGRGAAQDIQTAVAGEEARASETREESLRQAPYLFNLTALQKYMSTRYKWNAKRTLEAAQRCYEQHKVLTYPRTNASCLPSDYRPEVERLVKSLADDPDYGESARFLQKNGRQNDKRTFNDDGVDDHFAIIPTGRHKGLSGDDGKVYDAVVRRFLATFFPPAVYDKVKRTTVVANQHFRTGPVETLIVPGWLAVYDRKSEERPVAKLPALKPGAKIATDIPVDLLGTELKEEQTKAPARISEAGLLGLMEHAGRQVENEELAQALMSAEGLGTAATRADIIQNLKAKEYIDESLRPTFKGIHLITTLKKVKAERLTSPELTARLELELQEVEKGQRQSATFMGEVARYTTEVVDVAKSFDLDRAYSIDGPLGTCPACKLRPVVEQALEYACDPGAAAPGMPRAGCGFLLSKDLGARYLDRLSAQMLVQSGETPLLDGFKSHKGQEFKARMRLRDGRIIIIGTDGEETMAAPSLPSTTAPVRAGASKGGEGREHARTVFAPCPMHKGCNIFETRAAYVCETRLKEFSAGVAQPQGIMIGKAIAGRPMQPSELALLLTKGRTSELIGFTSKAGRKFNASLSLRADGTVAFEFDQPRPSAGPANVKYPPRSSSGPAGRTETKRRPSSASREKT